MYVLDFLESCDFLRGVSVLDQLVLKNPVGKEAVEYLHTKYVQYTGPEKEQLIKLVQSPIHHCL